MKIILFLMNIFAFGGALLASDDMDKVLSEVEKNNTTLAALRKSVDAEKFGNKTDIFLQNPEVEFNYLWGSPSVIGDRKDFSISQTFDFPTAYRYRNQISDLRNEQAELEYQRQRLAILKETREVCYDLIYVNALRAERLKRLDHAQSIGQSFKERFEKGDVNILEYNNAQLNLVNVRREVEAQEIERAALLSALSRLNGGKAVDFSRSSYPVLEIPDDFDQWYTMAEQKNPTFGWLKKEVEISQKQADLNKAIRLPKLQTGYMSESVVGEQFQGVTLGVSVPLWENKNKVKYAKANAMAMESVASDQKLQFYHHLKAIHAKVIALQKNGYAYRSALGNVDNSALAKKALDMGEISIIDYMIQLSLYYESVDKLLELEKEINKANLELIQYQ
ncbi:MAG TPA: TolC family protein [Prolixibacteraceae bacterium]|nr:TolC family protein [Prolixibacteraceae bacterium]